MNFLQKLSAKFAWLALALICLGSFALMLHAAWTDSAIMDELAHIPAGYGYVHNLDYRLNPEHPPLLKALAMFPVLFLNPTFPTQISAWQNQVNGEWAMGTAFLYQSGNDGNAIIRTARVVPILVTILTIILIYGFARRLIGAWWALVPAFIFAFDPTVLAQGHYVTTDVAAAFGVLFSLFWFVRFTETPLRGIRFENRPAGFLDSFQARGVESSEGVQSYFKQDSAISQPETVRKPADHAHQAIFETNSRFLWFAGLSFGIAQLMKFSTPLLVPLYIALYAALWVRDMILAHQEIPAGFRFKEIVKKGLRYAKNLIIIFAIGYIIVVYPVYFLFTYHYPIAKQVADTTAILTSFAGGPTPAGEICQQTRCIANLDIWMTHNPVLRPFAEYLLGILMVLQRSDGGNTIYFLGRIVGSGGPSYFPILYVLKEPIPTLAIVFLGLILALWWAARKAFSYPRRILANILDYIAVNFAEFAMGSFVVFYWAYSMQSTLNIGLRHIMPTLPLIAILAAGVWKKWATRLDLNQIMQAGMRAFAGGASIVASAGRALFSSIVKVVLLLALLLWLLIETLVVSPNFLSYFNEFAGGTANGYHYVTDSNYDWGQDLLRLQSWVDGQNQRCTLVETAAPCGIQKIAVDYFGGGDPAYYLGAKEVNWSSSKGNPADQGIHWLAVSVNTLEGATQPLAPGQTRNASDTYSWLVALRPPAPGMGNVPTPDYRIGTSIFVYKL